MSEWRERRAARVGALQAEADALVGRTIAAATVEPHDEDCDCVNVLRLVMADGSAFIVAGGYGGYTGHSCDEYVELIEISGVGGYPTTEATT